MCFLRFLAALAPAHLLQNSRDTKALHPVFFRPVWKRAVLSPGFSDAPETFSCDLRKFLTDFAPQDCYGGTSVLSFGEVAIGSFLSETFI